MPPDDDGDAPGALPHPDLVAAIPRLRRYARVLTGEATRADDLVQDTLARAWEKRRLWQAGTDLRAWLFTIMHNVFVNQRALARRDARNVSLDDDAEGREVWQIAVRAGTSRSASSCSNCCARSADCRPSSARCCCSRPSRK